MCIDMGMDMYAGIHVNACADMWVDVCTDMVIVTCSDTHMWVDVCTNMFIVTCSDTHTDTCTGMCAAGHVCGIYTRVGHETASRHASRLVYRLCTEMFTGTCTD